MDYNIKEKIEDIFVRKSLNVKEKGKMKYLLLVFMGVACVSAKIRCKNMPNDNLDNFNADKVILIFFST